MSRTRTQRILTRLWKRQQRQAKGHVVVTGVLGDILRLECGEAAAPDLAKAAPRIPDDARRKLAQVSAELEELGFELSATNPDAAGKLCAFATYLDRL